MLLQFKTSDDEIFICDVQFLNWARVSAPGTDQQSQVLEHGKLIPQGFGVYALEGRTPPGISSIGTYLVGLGNTIKIYIRANVPIKDFTMPAPIRQILYEILPNDPKQIEQSIQEIANAQGNEAAEPQRQEEPAGERALPGGEPQAEQPASEATVELGDGQVG
jgi:hypothetical protein